MAGFLALGTGFVNAANERQKENRDERRETRKLAMEVFLKDSLPRIRASRAKDDEAVTRMNTLMADSYYKGQPGLAFYATKWMGQTGKDESAFREHVATNQLPEPIKQAQQAELQKHFNYNEGSNSFSWKDQIPSVQPAQAQEGGSSNWYNRIMGGGNEAKDIQKGTNTVAQAAGVDPNAPTTSRFDSINLPGEIKSVDQKAVKQQETAFAMLMRDPEGVKNFEAATKAYATGGAEAGLKALQFIPPDVRKDKEFQDGIKKAMSSAILNNLSDMKDPNGALALFAGNRLNIASMAEVLGKGIRNPEEKAKLASELKAKYSTPDSQLDWIALMADTDRFKQLYPDTATRKAVQESVMQTINTMQMTSQQKLMDQMAPGTVAQNPGLGLTTAEDLRAPPPATDPKDVEAAMYEPGGLVVKAAKPKEAAVADKGKTLLEEEEALNDIAVSAAPELIRTQRDPVKLLQAATRSRTDKTPPGRQAEIARNLTLTPEVSSRIINDTDYGNEFQQLITSEVEPYLDEFATIAEAQAVVHPFGLAKVNGNIIVVPPKRN